MVIDRISEALFPGDGDGETHPLRLAPEEGAAGLLIEAAQREGGLTEVECDLVDAALMKLFLLPGPQARAMREEARARQAASTTSMTFAAAAAALPPEKREQLVTHLWAVADSDASTSGMERELFGTVGEVFGLPRERVLALRASA